MARQPTKCCCCIPLRPGLLAWAYIKLVLALTSVGVYVFIIWDDLEHFELNVYKESIYSNPVIYILELLLPLGVSLLYLLFNIFFIIGVHLENSKLLLVFLVYSIFEVIIGGAVVGWEVYELVDHLLYYRRHYAELYHGILHSYLDDPILYLLLIFPVVFNILLPIYFMVLIKSELQRLKISRGGTRVVLDQPVAIEQDKRYNFVYFGETPDRRKPLFPVKELERVRQQLRIKNV